MIDKLYSDFLHEKGFECRSYYGSNYRGLEDSATYDMYSFMENWVWDKLQDGLYVEVNGVRFNPDLVEYGDEAYGIEDYLDESVSDKNNKKVNEDFSTDTSDIDGMVDAILDFVYTYDFNDACDSDSIDSDTGEFTEDAIEETKEMLMDKDERLADYLNDIIDTLSPGERYDGKIDDIIDYLRGWDNKGGDKLHAMSMKNEDINQEDSSDVDKTNEAYDYDYINTITADQMDDAVEEGYPVKVVINGEYYDYKSMRQCESVNSKKLKEAYSGVDLNDYKDLIYAVLDAVDTLDIELGSETNKRARQLLNKLEHDEYAQRIDKDVDDWEDEDYDSEYEYKVDKKQKEVDNNFDEYGHPYNESVEEETEADDEFVDGEEKTDENMNESLSGFKKLPVKSFERNPSEQTQVPQTAQVEDEVADESFAHDDSM